MEYKFLFSGARFSSALLGQGRNKQLPTWVAVSGQPETV